MSATERHAASVSAHQPRVRRRALQIVPPPGFMARVTETMG